VQDRISRERLDLNSYEFQPLAALTKSSSFAAKRSLDIVPSYHSPVPNQLQSPRFKPNAALTLLSIFTNPKVSIRRTSYIPSPAPRSPIPIALFPAVLAGIQVPASHMPRRHSRCPQDDAGEQGDDLAQPILVSAVLTAVGGEYS
jgi:hypothetical protein